MTKVRRCSIFTPNLFLKKIHIFQAKRSGRYDQGILDVGLTSEDRVELARTHTFHRKHATGKAKIELHVLHVERGKKNYTYRRPNKFTQPISNVLQ